MKNIEIKDIIVCSSIVVLLFLDIIIISMISGIKKDNGAVISDTQVTSSVSAEVETEAVTKEQTEEPTESLEEITQAPIEETTAKQEEVVEKKPGEGKTLYLTFDDGPTQMTRTVLDVLDKYDVKATFFVIKTLDENCYDLYKEIIDRGHTLAVHSYTHNYDVVYANLDSYIADVNAIRDFVFEKTGYKPDIYRFPGGSSSTLGSLDRKECIRYLNSQQIVYFDWNSSSGDASSSYVSIASIEKNVFGPVYDYDESIILMHDTTAKITTVTALSKIIERGLSEGFTFKAITKDTTPIQQILASGVN